MKGAVEVRKSLQFRGGLSMVITCYVAGAVQHNPVNRNDKAGGFCGCPDQWATAKAACFVVHEKIIEMTTSVRIV